MTTVAGGPQAGPALVGYLLALADDALVLSHRCGEWIARGPQIEEDVALANIGLDLLGQARALLTHAGDVEGAGRDEDGLAYLRPPQDFRNAHLAELPNGDFAVTMARLLAFSAYQLELYRALTASTDAVLSGVAGKGVKEVAYHLDHASEWVVRLGDGTEVSHARMQAGLDLVLPHAEELFDGSWVDPVLVARGVAVDPSTLRRAWQERLDAVLRRATLKWSAARPVDGGGRRGEHTQDLVALLAEMQQLHRSEPGASW